MSIYPPVAVHIGIDNQCVVTIGTNIIDHMAKRQGTKLREDNGAIRLAGTVSPLQALSSFKKLWGQRKDGHLWEFLQKTLEHKRPKVGDVE